MRDDPAHDLAVLQIEGRTLPSLALGDSSQVREGEIFLFTGFPLGAALGMVPVTHRAMISALTPIALPTANARELQARAIKQLAGSPYLIMQLDATAYPGNSGSPLYHPDTGEVMGVVNMVFVKGSQRDRPISAQRDQLCCARSAAESAVEVSSMSGMRFVATRLA